VLACLVTICPFQHHATVTWNQNSRKPNPAFTLPVFLLHGSAKVALTPPVVERDIAESTTPGTGLAPSAAWATGLAADTVAADAWPTTVAPKARLSAAAIATI
jgi:hypothetical protein